MQELGELVELGASEDTAAPRDSGIVTGGDGRPDPLSVPDHRPKLEHSEDFTALAKALGSIEHRKALREYGSSGTEQEERGPDRGEKNRKSKVDRPEKSEASSRLAISESVSWGQGGQSPFQENGGRGRGAGE